ncbi:MAG: nucleotidyltransferase domain-containing protein [Calditrichaeota bacterium]|nr:MAG: nucleotidyltransferase domain-containing protein [Calditrichota bacterium]
MTRKLSDTIEPRNVSRTHSPIPEFITDIVSKIVQGVSPEKIILFGSYVSGDITPDSDVDLLIIMPTSLRPAERIRLISRLLYPRVAPLDIIVKTPEEILAAQNRVDPFLHEILERGIVLYAKSGRSQRMVKESRS